ncbi:hypothetical protein GDO81_025739 [Engystomops pustulosus]|uniref:Uncharacterized protein n=1 Tax=Engystomops pustulosus TaxID=76066 RepID=A0AAV6YJB3_ENGPU|nr:hypothetical protein GDO81_025739 [Engystomops pustulosus]
MPTQFVMERLGWLSSASSPGRPWHGLLPSGTGKTQLQLSSSPFFAELQSVFVEPARASSAETAPLNLC